MNTVTVCRSCANEKPIRDGHNICDDCEWELAKEAAPNGQVFGVTKCPTCDGRKVIDVPTRWRGIKRAAPCWTCRGRGTV